MLDLEVLLSDGSLIEGVDPEATLLSIFERLRLQVFDLSSALLATAKWRQMASLLMLGREDNASELANSLKHFLGRLQVADLACLLLSGMVRMLAVGGHGSGSTAH